MKPVRSGSRSMEPELIGRQQRVSMEPARRITTYVTATRPCITGLKAFWQSGCRPRPGGLAGGWARRWV